MGRKKKTKDSKMEYHKQEMRTYRAIDRIDHKLHFKPVVRSGEICVIPIDKEDK